MLMVAMMAIAVMTIQGSVALTASLNNITRSIDTRVVTDATATAQAGIEEARARLVGLPTSNLKLIGDPLATLNLSNPAPNLLWSAYVLTSSSWTFGQDPDYKATYTNYIPAATLVATTITPNSVQAALPYWAKIRHKRELDAENAGHRTTSPHYTDNDGLTTLHNSLNPGNIIYYGYMTATSTIPVQFTTSLTTVAPPVELISSYGKSGNLSRGIQVEATRESGPPVIAALYSQGNVNFTQAGGSINGVDNCSRDSAHAPIYTKSPGTVSGTTTLLGVPLTPQQGTTNIDLAKYIDALKGGATIVTADISTDTTFGSSTNYVTVYSDTSSPANVGGLSLKNVTGYGLLLVKGDLTVDNAVEWNGPVIVTGVLSFKSASSSEDNNVSVNGAILAGSVNAIKKGFDIRYDSCQIAKSMASRPLKVLRWRRL
jgi:hypothetical protein